MRFWMMFVLCVAPLISMAQQAFFKEYWRDEFNAQKSIKCYTASEVADGFLIAGVKYDVSYLDSYTFIAKLDNQGDLMSLTLDSTYYIGQYVSSIIKDNSMYIVGIKEDIAPVKQRQKFLAKFTLSGDILWIKPFGDTSKYLFDNSVRKIQSTDSGLIVFGSSTGTNGTTDAEVTFLTDEGDVQYRKLFTTEESLQLADIIHGIANQHDGYVLLLKSPSPSLQNNHYTLIKIDFEGNELWRKTITNMSFPEHNMAGLINETKGITQNKDNGTVVVFSTENNPGGQSSQIILAVFDDYGNLVNSKVSLNDAHQYVVYFVESNADSEVFLAGSKTGSTTESYDLFTAKFDSDLNLLSNKNWWYEGNELSNDGTFLMTSDGGVLLGGSKYRFELNGFNFVLAKTDCMGNVEWDNHACISPSEEEVVVMGNPMINDLLIQFPQLGSDNQLEFELINAIGQVVRKRQYSGGIITENVEDLSHGIYIYTVKTSQGNVFTGKLLKE
ncbi:T9SS type A sorting domain-containing protein [Fluviicola taffensis]|uniref:Secretion system C-terminal sorting domain-containing protein n=1 Tax=Fluviicola taffensis (strain DSM 16823 / NCIMB 13979 / RW262) TaxID=755732 RepID=F2IKE6_FLUTR|nr:T9SS type A sorting domain-containing protein [Fluviicola taffensis]AEA45072.1 hypothetical protein Fluta_3098 [Fluviicola taffensis DSM 16823]